ncbi:MAG TPA: DNA translocase FtsK [Anaerolineae bacterium]|nr:DNA translocase FtsK [Anaerolineae bacterium]
MQNQALHFQADRIELVLAAHRLPARVTGGQVTPRLVRFQVATPLGVRLDKVQRLSEEIALSLGSPSCRVFRQNDQLQVEVPRDAPQAVPLLGLLRRLSQETRAIPAHTALLGLDQDGVPLLLRLPSPDVAHVLIAGTTGSGKTALARSIITSLAMLNPPQALQLLLIDPKARGLAPLASLPHLLLPVLSRTEEALGALQRLVVEMEHRDRNARCTPRIVVVLDELADLVQTGGRPMETALTRLTQRGREAGIHLIACAQKPTALVIGSLVKSNFPVRLVGAVASPEDAKVASGLPNTGAERLLGQGDFLLIAKGQVMRLQAAYIDPAGVAAVAAGLRPGPSKRYDLGA